MNKLEKIIAALREILNDPESSSSCSRLSRLLGSDQRQKCPICTIAKWPWGDGQCVSFCPLIVYVGLIRVDNAYCPWSDGVGNMYWEPNTTPAMRMQQMVEAIAILESLKEPDK
jgi:hypothetical protein